MERRRLKALDEEALKPLRRGWHLGREQFKEQMLELMEGKLGESQPHHRRGAGAPGLAGVLALAPPNFDTPNFGPWTLDFGP